MRAETAARAEPFLQAGGACGRDQLMAGARGGRERARINMGEPYEVDYWTRALGISKEKLAAIVAKVGDRVEAVRREIGEESERGAKRD